MPGRQRTDTEGTSGVSSMGPSSYDSDNKDIDDSNWTTNDDIEALIDEAKTMISLGSYHENIVNLQGMTVGVVDATIHRVCSFLPLPLSLMHQ